MYPYVSYFSFHKMSMSFPFLINLKYMLNLKLVLAITFNSHQNRILI